MDIRKWYEKYSIDIRLVYNSEATRENYKSQVYRFLNHFMSEVKKRIHAHLMRHCSFTHMVEQGTDINLIQRLAGHNSVKTTAIYTHISHNVVSKITSPISAINL